MSNKKCKLSAIALAAIWSLCISLSTTQLAGAKAEQALATPLVDVQIDNKPYQMTKMVVMAKAEQVWQILNDFNSATKIFPTIKKCSLIEDRGSSKIVHYLINPIGILCSYQYDLEFTEVGHHELQWHRVGGDFKEISGFWKLEPLDCGRSTLVTYASYVSGGIFMPQALIKHQCRIDVPQNLAALKLHAENMQLASRAQRNAN